MNNKETPNNMNMKIEVEYNDCECSYENDKIEKEFVIVDGLYTNELRVFIDFLKSQGLDESEIRDLFGNWMKGYI